MKTTIEGKTIYLTGASHGIGRALALRLLKERARLAICGRDQAALDEVARAAGSPDAVFRMAFDLAEEAKVLGFYAGARTALGPPDVLINNAAFSARRMPLWETTTAEFDAMVAVNLRAPFILLREAAKDMKVRGGGHIVNILSTVNHFDNENMSGYTATKRGLHGLAGVLRKEIRPHGVRVSSVYPGGTNTGFRTKPRPEYLQPESVAEAVIAVLTLPEDLVVHEFTFRPMIESNF